MNWTKEIPKVPGYYWFIDSKRKEKFPEIVMIVGNNLPIWEILYLKSFGMGYLKDVADFKDDYLFAGPIPKPESVEHYKNME